MIDSTFPFQTIIELAARLRAREVTAVTLTEQSLERIRALDERLHAFIALTAARARAQARAADLALQAGVDLGPLHGIPFAVKDLYDVAGVATTAGTSLLADNIARADAAAVRRLTSAGMVLI